MTTRLYSRSDIVGRVLSAWRARAVQPCVAGTLLDVACGDNRLVRRYGSGVGVDIVRYEQVDVVCHDLSRLPFSDGCFGTVAILAALNYFDDPDAVLREIRRILRPDGTLLVTFLNKNVSRLWHSIRERQITPRPSFDRVELMTCLRAANLRIVDERSFMLGLNTIYFIKR